MKRRDATKLGFSKIKVSSHRVVSVKVLKKKKPPL
jgi:hypothetical protein